MSGLPIEIINNIFLYVSSPISKLLRNSLFSNYYYTIRILDNNVITLYNYWIFRKIVFSLNTVSP